MKLIISSDKASAGAKTAKTIAEMIRLKPDLVLGLVTGNSVIDAYALLSQKQGTYAADWSKVKVFLLDEFSGLDENDPASCQAFMRKHLYDKVNIDKANIFAPDGKGDPDKVASEYEELIKSHGGMDLLLLGLGTNGHIGGNEPGSPFDSRTRVVALTDGSIDALVKEFGDRSRVPKQAITLGLGTINEARKIVLIATGSSKADAICGLLEGMEGPEKPCTSLRRHPDATIIVDKAAGAKLHKGFMTSLTGRATYNF